DEEVRDLPGCPAGSRVLPLRPLRGVSRPIVAGIPSGCRELPADPHDQGRDVVELRFYNPQTGKLLPAVHELDREIETRDLALREAAVALREAAVARREAEQEVQRLRREVEELR